MSFFVPSKSEFTRARIHREVDETDFHRQPDFNPSEISEEAGQQIATKIQNKPPRFRNLRFEINKKCLDR